MTDDYQTAQLSDTDRAMLDYAAKVTLYTWKLEAAYIDSLK